MSDKTLCECGCGQALKVWEQQRPHRFLRAHHFRRRERYRVEERGYTTPCWVWMGYKNKDGYGLVYHKGKTRLAHRVYFEESSHRILTREIVLDHLCNQRDCVRPEHVMISTSLDNSRRGKNTVLTVNLVSEIKSRIDERGSDLAREYGVSPQLICDIRKGRRWEDVEPA